MNVVEYRQKPIKVDALQYTGYNLLDVIEFMKGSIASLNTSNPVTVKVKNEMIHLRTGDYIVKTTKNELCVYKETVFKQLYEPVMY